MYDTANGEGKRDDNERGVVAVEVLKNFVGGGPVAVEVEEELEVPDPATGELLGRVPLSGAEDVDRAVQAHLPRTPGGRSGALVHD